MGSNLIKDLVNKLKKDSDFYYAYQSNIAVKFQDEYKKFKNKSNNKKPNFDDIHYISNEAAKKFLDLLISG